MNPTDEQLDNLARLADALVDKVPAEHFDLDTYRIQDDGLIHLDEEVADSALSENACGTSACAIGWAPVLLDEPRWACEMFVEYGDRVFGLEGSITDEPWGYAFSDRWEGDQNTVEATAYRIRQIVEAGGGMPPVEERVEGWEVAQ